MPCKEPCKWGCPHFKCDKLCFEPCQRPPCNRPCPKKLRCEKCRRQYPCGGLCGEKCPTNLCPKCDPAPELFLGNEEEPDARFLQLPCGHVFEVRDMDQYMGMAPAAANLPLSPVGPSLIPSGQCLEASGPSEGQHSEAQPAVAVNTATSVPRKDQKMGQGQSSSSLPCCSQPPSLPSPDSTPSDLPGENQTEANGASGSVALSSVSGTYRDQGMELAPALPSDSSGPPLPLSGEQQQSEIQAPGPVPAAAASVVQLKKCPECRTPIRACARYNAVIKQTLLDLEEVKRRVLQRHQVLVSAVERLERDVLDQLRTLVGVQPGEPLLLGKLADTYKGKHRQMRKFFDLKSFAVWATYVCVLWREKWGARFAKEKAWSHFAPTPTR